VLVVSERFEQVKQRLATGRRTLSELVCRALTARSFGHDCLALNFKGAPMSSTAQNMKESRQTASRSLAAEDIQVGSYVTVVREVCEIISCLWAGEVSAADREHPVLYRHIPKHSGQPQKVLAVCLPFVFVEDLNGGTQTLDLRRCEISLLSKDFVDIVRKKGSARFDCLFGDKNFSRKRKSGSKRKSGKKDK
jgi:hypothetical protein